MNALDLDFSVMVSQEIAQALRMTYDDGEPVFYGVDETYYIPLLFEDHVKNQPAQLWPCEFRRARDTVRGGMEQHSALQWEGVPVADIFNGALICLHALALEMVPEIAQELQPEERARSASDMPDNLPPQIVTAADHDLIAAVFGALEVAGYLNSAWKPTNSAPANRDKAYMARAIAQLLGVYDWAAAFSYYWGVPNLSAQACQAKLNDTREGIEKTLAEAVSKNEKLKATVNGRKLIKKYCFA